MTYTAKNQDAPKQEEVQSSFAQSEEMLEAEAKAGVELICGVPRYRLDLVEANLKPGAWKEWKACKAVLIRFQKHLDTYGYNPGMDEAEEAILKVKFQEIDESGGDEKSKHRAKVRAAAQQIDPILFYRNLKQGLSAGDPYARKLYSDIMGLAIEAKTDAKDDRPPSISINFGSYEEDEVGNG